MSLKTWKKEFYKKKPNKRMSKLEAVEHSLLKWRGAQRRFTKKHDVVFSEEGVSDPHGIEDLVFDAYSCALCIKYIESEYCSRCPLVLSGFKNCDQPGSSYMKFEATGDPKQMIRELRTVLKLVKGNKI